MPSFVFTYRLTPGVHPPHAESAAAWRAWFDGMGGHVADIGKPAPDAAALGNCGPGTELGGYSLISAADLDAALAVAKGCPSLTRERRRRGRPARRRAGRGQHRRPGRLSPSRPRAPPAAPKFPDWSTP